MPKYGKKLQLEECVSNNEAKVVIKQVQRVSGRVQQSACRLINKNRTRFSTP